MSKELETRNRAMYQQYASGKSIQAIADRYDITRQRASQIIAKYAQDMAVTDDENRHLHRAQLEHLINEMMGIVAAPPAPAYDVKGNMLIDENGEPVRDYEQIIKAADQVRKLSESIRRMDATDLPRRKQLQEDEAMRAMKEYLASLPNAQIEELCQVHHRLVPPQ